MNCERFDTVMGKLSLITERDKSMQLSIGIEPVTRFQQLLGMIPRFEVLKTV
jgi:hypothetical protein